MIDWVFCLVPKAVAGEKKAGRKVDVGGPRSWPSVDEQLSAAKVVKGSALERLIRENQDFSILHPHEAKDNLGFPPWLRVYWRKAHPEGEYLADDPSGGYPRVLHRIHEWLLTHQDRVSR